MELLVPWTELVSLIEPYAPEIGCRGQQPFAVQPLLRIHFMQQWFKLSDPAMEEALHDVPAFRDFVGLDKRAYANKNVRWRVAVRPGLRRAVDKDKDKPADALINQLERTKASIRAKVDRIRHWVYSLE